MAGSPLYKVYDWDEKYIAAFKHPIHAVAFVATLGVDGVTIRFGHRHIVWTEGAETIPAYESYDLASDIILKRIEGEFSHGTR